MGLGLRFWVFIGQKRLWLEHPSVTSGGAAEPSYVRACASLEVHK